MRRSGRRRRRAGRFQEAGVVVDVEEICEPMTEYQRNDVLLALEVRRDVYHGQRWNFPGRGS